MKFPDKAVPVGYSWKINYKHAGSQFRSLFKDIKISKASAQVEFEKVISNKIAVLLLKLALIGTTSEGIQVVFALRTVNYFDIPNGRLLKVVTDPKIKNTIMIRLKLDSEKLLINGIGYIEILTEYSYPDAESLPGELTTNPKNKGLIGRWAHIDSKTGKVDKLYVIEFQEVGKIIFTHPGLEKNKNIIEKGTWALNKNVLTVQIDNHRDIFELTITENKLILKRTIATANPSSIFPWRIKQSDTYSRLE